MEKWKDVAGYEGRYQVSNLGNVRSVTHKDAKGHEYKGRVLKQQIANGYYRVHLSNGSKNEYFFVHRLVATAFCENPEGCDIVNHLDCNTLNNCAENLEWTTYKGNMQWASKLGRMPANEQAYRNIELICEKRKTPVIATDQDGNEFLFASQKEAAETLGVNRGHIAAACRKEYGYKKVAGYSFRYADEEKAKQAIPKKVGMSRAEVNELTRQRMIGNTYMNGKTLSDSTKKKLSEALSKPVCQYSKSGEFIAEYPSASYIRKTTGLVIDFCLSGKTKTAGGYVWKYKEKQNE